MLLFLLAAVVPKDPPPRWVWYGLVFGRSSLLSFAVGNAMLNLMYMRQPQHPFHPQSRVEAVVLIVGWFFTFGAVMVAIEATRNAWTRYRAPPSSDVARDNTGS